MTDSSCLPAVSLRLSVALEPSGNLAFGRQRRDHRSSHVTGLGRSRGSGWRGGGGFRRGFAFSSLGPAEGPVLN